MAGGLRLCRSSAAGFLKKYRYLVIVIVAGILLMAIPTREKDRTGEESQRGSAYSVEETERRMEEILSRIQGTGKLEIMLTLKSASQLQLAEDSDISQRDGDRESRSEPLTINRGSGYQDVVVTGEVYPEFQGAVVVCEGADNSSVHLAVSEAVAALTGLGADKISIVKWQS